MIYDLNDIFKNVLYLIITLQFPNSANIYMFKVSNRNIRKRCEICSMLTTKRRRSAVFIVNFNYFTSSSNISTADFVNASEEVDGTV